LPKPTASWRKAIIYGRLGAGLLGALKRIVVAHD